MITINLFDSNFPDQACSVAHQTPELVRYVRNRREWDGITLFTDGWLFSDAVDRVQSHYKVGWLHEGRCLHPENYVRSWEVRHKFDAILTYAGDLIGGDPAVYRRCIRGGSWIRPSQWGFPAKSRMVSLILSDKTALEGHALRHQIANCVPGIDLFGARGAPIGTDKYAALAPYRFSVVVEPCNHPGYFTEHLLDCLALGTIPLYWGCGNIENWFHPFGMLRFANVPDLTMLLATLTPAEYDALLPYARENQERARQYAITDDWLVRGPLAAFVREVA